MKQHDATALRDPQALSHVQKVVALLALGRVPLASEVPLWTMFGCVLAARLFPPAATAGGSDSPLPPPVQWATVLTCMFITWATNISINYGNDYFDWNMDHPGQLLEIRKSLERAGDPRGRGAAVEGSSANEKIMGRTTRVIHDGTFPPVTALVLAALVQGAIVGVLLVSRARAGAHSPFQGLALAIGAVSTVLSQGYVGPPLRLHYRGFGEAISALLLNPVATLFGMVGYYTATSGRAVRFSDLLAGPHDSSSGFTLGMRDGGGGLAIFLVGMFFYELARILVMHVGDIPADVAGGKHTMVSRIGHGAAARLYVVCNAAALALHALFVARLVRAPSLVGEPRPDVIRQGLATAFAVLVAGAAPVVTLTAKSLFAHDPARPQPASIRGKVMPLASLPGMVTAQVLLSPLLLTGMTLLHW
ncbi:hypothetical protein Q5752_001068 [Cryptotrichosporon argae]